MPWRPVEAGYNPDIGSIRETRMRAASICLLALILSPPALARPAIEHLRVPAGFRIDLFAENVDDARGMVFGPAGTLFVGSRERGQVYAVRDVDGDGRADVVKVIAKGLRMPVGVAMRDGDLYVSAVERIYRFDDIEHRLDAPGAPKVVVDDLPDRAHHGWRYIAFGPDGKLYVPIGAPCNLCEEPGYAVILRMRPDGSAREVVARGVRNSVGFDWNPADGRFWFTDNGRDWLGDDTPDCELNTVVRLGEHFGYPYCHAGDVLDPEFGKGKVCTDYTPPAAKLGAHVAPLGMRFYTGKQFPAAWRGGAFIALHGSWNRAQKSGYAVVYARIVDGKVSQVIPFVTGFLDGQKTLGRPVDVIQAGDGSLLISDDYANAIYRVRWVGSGGTEP